MFEAYKPVIAQADDKALKEAFKLIHVFIVFAEHDIRLERRRLLDDITAQAIQVDLKEALTLIIYRLNHGALIYTWQKNHYVESAAQQVLSCTMDDFEDNDIRGMRAALKLIRGIARIQGTHFRGQEAEAFPLIVKTAQDALNGVYPSDIDEHQAEHS